MTAIIDHDVSSEQILREQILRILAEFFPDDGLQQQFEIDFFIAAHQSLQSGGDVKQRQKKFLERVDARSLYQALKRSSNEGLYFQSGQRAQDGATALQIFSAFNLDATPALHAVYDVVTDGDEEAPLVSALLAASEILQLDPRSPDSLLREQVRKQLCRINAWVYRAHKESVVGQRPGWLANRLIYDPALWLAWQAMCHLTEKLPGAIDGPDVVEYSATLSMVVELIVRIEPLDSIETILQTVSSRVDDHTEARARLLFTLGYWYRLRDRLEDAKRYYQEAERQAKNSPWKILSTIGQCVVLRALGEETQAEAVLQRSWSDLGSFLDQIRDDQIILQLRTAGNALLEHSEYGMASELALKIAVACSDYQLMGNVYLKRATRSVDRKDRRSANDELVEARRAFERTGDTIGVERVELHRLELDIDQCNQEQLDKSESLVARFEHIGDLVYKGHAWRLLGRFMERTYNTRGSVIDLEKASAYLELAVGCYLVAGHRQDEAEAAHELARLVYQWAKVEQEAGRYSQAIARLDHSEGWFSRASRIYGEGGPRLAAARAQADQGRQQVLQNRRLCLDYSELVQLRSDVENCEVSAQGVRRLADLIAVLADHWGAAGPGQRVLKGALARLDDCFAELQDTEGQDLADNCHQGLGSNLLAASLAGLQEHIKRRYQTPILEEAPTS